MVVHCAWCHLLLVLSRDNQDVIHGVLVERLAKNVFIPDIADDSGQVEHVNRKRRYFSMVHVHAITKNENPLRLVCDTTRYCFEVRARDNIAHRCAWYNVCYVF
jgi:hypothetical protein